MRILTTIVIVDDEEEILTALEQMLSGEGYVVKAFSSSKEAESYLKTKTADLAVFDIKMPELDGFSLLKSVRVHRPSLPIIFLSSKAEEQDQIIGFTLGADDYITKPIKPRALISRINALFRRDIKKNTGSSKINIGNLEIDRTSYTVKLDNKKIILPKKEFELLFFLAHNPNQVFSRDDLLKNIWGSDVYVLARTVDVHIRKVREKIGDGFIITIKGVGYKFVGD